MMYSWSRYGGYEVSTAGDKRFSALIATLSDGRTIEDHYQCDIKGYRTWREGKGKPPIGTIRLNALWSAYLSLWEQWADKNNPLLVELASKAQNHNCVLSDQFATSKINQANALSTILNLRVVGF